MIYRGFLIIILRCPVLFGRYTGMFRLLTGVFKPVGQEVDFLIK